MEDSAAWDECAFDYDYYAFSDGFNTTSDAEALAHQRATGASYSVKDHYATVHHGGRLKSDLGYMSPRQYREGLGLAA